MKVTQAALAKANAPIVGTMTVSEARRIGAAQRSVVKKFGQAAVQFIQDTEGRDLEAEYDGWLPYDFETDHRAKGVVIVRQYRANEKGPNDLRQVWTINKKDLVK